MATKRAAKRIENMKVAATAPLFCQNLNKVNRFSISDFSEI